MCESHFLFSAQTAKQITKCSPAKCFQSHTVNLIYQAVRNYCFFSQESGILNATISLRMWFKRFCTRLSLVLYWIKPILGTIDKSKQSNTRLKGLLIEIKITYLTLKTIWHRKNIVHTEWFCCNWNPFDPRWDLNYLHPLQNLVQYSQDKMAPVRPGNALLKSNLGRDSEHTLHAYAIYCAQILVAIWGNL